METRHSVETYFVREFPAIYYRCGVLAAGSRQNWNIFEKYLRFFGKSDPLWWNFENSVQKVYIATPIDVVVCKIREKLSDGKSVKSCVIYLTKKQHFGSLSNCRYCADRAQSLPGPARNIWLKTFQILSKSVHFQRSYSRPRKGRQNAPWSESKYSAKL